MCPTCSTDGGEWLPNPEESETLALSEHPEWLPNPEESETLALSEHPDIEIRGKVKLLVCMLQPIVCKNNNNTPLLHAYSL